MGTTADRPTHGTGQGKGAAKNYLSDWDYLKGVEDSLRMGGFRFKDLASGAYVNAASGYAVPPVLHIDELFASGWGNRSHTPLKK